MPAPIRTTRADQLIAVTLADGRQMMVRAGDLVDVNEPKLQNAIVVTTDGQMYQMVDGNWYRLLRTAKVNYAIDVAPLFKDKFSFDSTLGREASYVD